MANIIFSSPPFIGSLSRDPNVFLQTNGGNSWNASWFPVPSPSLQVSFGNFLTSVTQTTASPWKRESE
jgi:hypothetical protein